MKTFRALEFVIILCVIALLVSALRGPLSGGDPDLLLYLPFDGDANSHGALKLKTKAEGVTLESGPEGNTNGFATFTRGSFLSISDQTLFNGLDEFTLSAWVNPKFLREHLNVISKVDPARDFNLQIDRAGQVATHIAVDGYEFCYTKPLIRPNRWTHVAATFQNRTWTISVDGRVAGQQTVKNLPVWGARELTVGNLYAGANESFEGGLDEVRIYKRALSQAEIAELASR